MAPPLGELAPARVTEKVATFEILDTSLPSLPLQGTSPNGGGMGNRELQQPLFCYNLADHRRNQALSRS